MAGELFKSTRIWALRTEGVITGEDSSHNTLLPVGPHVIQEFCFMAGYGCRSSK